MAEGDEAEEMLAEQRRKTTPRRTLAGQDGFEDVSPEVGVLDEDAFDELMDEDPDAALALLADLTGATDQRLRELARRLAGRIVVELGRSGPLEKRGVGRMRSVRFDGGPGDLDVDASLEGLVEARSAGAPVDPDQLYVSRWARPATALSLVIDRSGSMGGDRLAAAAIAVAACAWRVPTDYSVIAFAERVMVIKSQDVNRPAPAVVDDVFTLRGHGPTDLALALEVAYEQLSRSRARRRLVVLLSDCRPTIGDDPFDAASRLDELCIVAPDDDRADADHLAAAAGARIATITGPADIPAAFARLLNPA